MAKKRKSQNFTSKHCDKMAMDTFTVANNSTSKAPTLPTLFQRKRNCTYEHQNWESRSKR
ncbi:hypothetical protein [Vibrio sp. SCSIO 43136]|uniref:hypothetical protein n=1 Tax=Vibrio sp. SCSIO 43136 TaxID=2819101 RepID=UPI002076592C|nr:hypothetical protein [Vibrio sp. SCSIO 43136]USD64085.1 hypothetical protein J4N39_08110 [Vibrio sp. SCSIO 43136]